MAALHTLQDKTLSDDSPSSSFRKSATLGLAPVDELLWTTATVVRVSGLQKLIGLCLQLEMIDVDCVSAQLF